MSSGPSRTCSVASSAPSVDWCQASVDCSTLWTATSRLHCVSSRLLNSLDCYQSTALYKQSTAQLFWACISRLLCRTSRLLCAISLLLCAISLLLCTISLLLCTRPSPSHLHLRFWPHSNTRLGFGSGSLFLLFDFCKILACLGGCPMIGA